MSDRSEPSRMPLIILRIAIVAVAAFALYWFRDRYSLSWEILSPPYDTTPWFNLLFAFGSGVIVPASAVAAAGLAIAGKRLGLAMILLGVGAIVYALPVVAMIIGVMIYGF